MLDSFESRAVRFIAYRFIHLFCRTFLAPLLIVSALTWPNVGFSQNWGTPQDNGCSSTGIRTFASRLWNIPWGQSWDAAYQVTPITIQGRTFASPTRCIDQGGLGEWGEWDIPDNACKPSWGTPQDNGCSSTGIRTFASRLWNIPPGQAWDAACQGTPITIQGRTFAS